MQMIFRTPGRKRATCALALLGLIALLYAALCAASGVDARSYPYPTYLLQAQAWLRGETALSQNYEWLELAVYEGRYYVSFPPVPSIPMLLYALLFGSGVPGGLFQKIYLAAACMVIFSELQRAGRMRPASAAAWAGFFCFASAMLPVSLVGGVWYEAEIMAFLFAVSAIAAVRRGRPTLACLLYALSVGCRPFSALLGPALLMLHLRRARGKGERLDAAAARGAMRKLVPGIAVGLLVAAAYGAYNYVRFGNPFEFGHNYLPEFMRSEHGQLSVHYLGKNLVDFLFGPPVRLGDAGPELQKFGFSMFLSSPIFICNLVWLAEDLVKRRMNWEKALLVALGALNVVLLCMHRTLGGFQFGMRYAMELAPFCLIYLLLSEQREMRAWEAALLGFGLCFNFWGACVAHV